MRTVCVLVLVLAGSAPAQSPPEALARYGAGIWKAKRDETASGIRQLEQAAKADPTALAPQKALIPLYLELGREPAAERLARKVLESEPEDVATSLALGKLLNGKRAFKDAAVVLTQAVSNAKKADDALLLEAAYQELARANEGAKDWPALDKTLGTWITFRANQKLAPMAELHVRRGLARKNIGHWDGAMEALDHAARLDDKYAKQLLRLQADIHAARGNPATAAALRAKDLDSNPAGVAPYALLADDLRAAKKDPVPVLAQHIQKFPQREEARWVLALETARANPAKIQDTRETLFQATTTKDDRELFALVARFCETIGSATDALTWMESLNKPQTVESTARVRARAMALQAIADHPTLAIAVVKQAAEEFRNGMTISPNTWEAVQWLAVKTGRDDEADRAALMAFNARQFTPEVCQAVFHYHDRRGDWDALKNACQTVIVLRKEGVLFSAYTSKAQALAELGRGDEALATLAEMDTRFDWTAEGKLQVKLNRIRILNVLNQSETALTTAKALLATVSTPAEQTRVRYVLADCYFALDKPQDGERVLREVLDEDPDDVLALNNLGYNLADQGRKLAEAEAMIRRAMALDADRRAREGNPIVESGIYLDSLGWVQFRRGDFVGAKRTFENALSHTEAKADAVVWDHAGDVAWRLKDKDKAVVYWTKAAELYSLRHTGRLHGRLDETKRKLDLAKSPKPPTTRPK